MRRPAVILSLLPSFLWLGNAASAVPTAAKSPPHTLHGGVSANETMDRLESAGIKAVLQTGKSDKLIIQKVRLGSAAFYKGVSEGDEVQSLKPVEAGFNLTFARGGKSYQVFLRPQLNSTQTEADKKADDYLHSLEKGIEDIQQARIKVAADEKAAPELAKKAEKEAMKNISKAKVGERAVEASEIAKTGSKAITQAEYPNCWFEAAVAAVAESPHGHEHLANMMIKTGDRTFRVTFPGDRKYIEVNLDDLEQSEVHDKALWARILDCGCLKKFPGNEGASGMTGIAILTGMPTHFIDPTEGNDSLNDLPPGTGVLASSLARIDHAMTSSSLSRAGARRS